MTTPFNAMSRCPVLSVPSGRAKNGVPTGIQIVGRTYSDADVFQAAMAYETAQGQWFRDAGTRPKL
jgi:amidase